MRIPGTAISRTRRLAGRSSRGMAGFTLIDSLLGLLISAVLIAPVLGGVFVILKTAPGTSTQGDGLSVTRNQTQVLQNFQLTNSTSILTSEWRQASIIKLLDTYRPDFGNDCNNGTTGSSLGTTPNFNKPVIALQTIGKADSALKQTGPPPLFRLDASYRGSKLPTPMGLHRVVYNLVGRVSGTQPVKGVDGTQLFDLVRRECAVESTGLPRVNPFNPNNDSCNDKDSMHADCRGWRLQPGTVNQSEVLDDLQASPKSWTPVRTVISNVKSIDKQGIRARQRGVTSATPVPGAPALTSCNDVRKYPGDPVDYDQCDVTLVVTFGDEDTDPSNNRVEKIYLSQGAGF
jgi:hypothetical protein